MGLVLRQSTINNGTNTITIKGSALSHIEGDSNFIHLLTNMSGSTISITGSNVGILSTNTTINGTFKLPSITNSNNNNLVTYNSSTGQLYYYNTASINVGTASYVNPLVQNVSLTGSIFVTSSGVTLGQFVGNQNGYVEFSVRNNNTGVSASGDIAIYADNGTTTNNYIDIGINNSGLSNTYFYGGTDFGNANDSYIYNVGGNLRIGNATSQAPYSQSLFIFSNPLATPDITITGSRVGIQKTGSLNAALDVSGSVTITGSLNVSGSGRFINDLTVTGSIISNTGMLVKHYPAGFTHATEDYEPGSTGTILYTSVGAQTGNTFAEITVRQNGGSLSSGVLALNASGGGAVAIGKSTATSTSALDINGNTIITGSLIVTGSLITTGSIGINTTASSTYQLDITNKGVTGTPSKIRLGDSGFGDVFTVGVGSTSQNYSDVYLNGSTYGIALYANPQAAVSSTVNGITYSTASVGLIAGGSSAPLVFGTQGTEKMRIHLTGDVSIGTQANNITGSGYKLNVTGSGVSGSLNVNNVLLVSGSSTRITGSLNISGSQTFNGTFISSGSHTLSGSNTIIGNTTFSGSIDVSGSSNFHNSLFIVTGSTYIKGVTQISGSTGITGSFDVIDGNINIVSGSSFTRWGNKLFNYGQFANTASITATQNVSGAFALPLTYFGDGISITSGSRVTFANSGIYNIQFSTVATQGGGTGNAHIWFRKTGSNIDNSDTYVVLAANSQILMSWNFAYPFSASEYAELWYHSNSTATSFTYNASGSGFPASPSIILTVTQIA